tara:strand:- start:2569 stop:2796 length:228 start_codon:yes stop_codon:yes gene_type:complete
MAEIEFRLVNDDEMPPVVITMNDRDEPKVVLNAEHKIWLCLHRKTIAGSAEALFEKIDQMLTGMLIEQRNDERMS